MTASPPGEPARDDLTPRVFRALFQGYDLHAVGGTYIAVAKGARYFTGTSLGDIARRISTAPARGPGTPPGDQPAGPRDGTCSGAPWTASTAPGPPPVLARGGFDIEVYPVHGEFGFRYHLEPDRWPVTVRVYQVGGTGRRST